MKYPEIIKVEFKERVKPNMSCGTGYDEPSIFILTTDTGETYERALYDWYRSEEDTARSIREVCYDLPIMNPMDATQMFIECWQKSLRGEK